MALKTDAVGKEWPATTYQVGREKIREYANALGIDNPVHQDVEAARAAGFRDVPAPPMFAVVYSSPALAPAIPFVWDSQPIIASKNVNLVADDYSNSPFMAFLSLK